SLGGRALMRRPAQHPRPSSAWSHPYTGVGALAVFYNSGGGKPPAPVPPSGDPNPAPGAPKPTPPAPVTVSMSQDELAALAAREKDQGKRAGARQALADFAAEHGFTSVDDAKAFIEAARQKQQEALTEQERAQQQLAADRAQVEKDRAALAAAQRTMAREQALIRLGAVDTVDEQGQVTAPNLQDAVALLERELRDTPEADATEVAAAAARVKQRHPALFGATQTPPAPPLPPAPGGAPAGGPPPRVPATKDDVKARALARAQKMGYARRDDAA
ncbi:hypothetical protein ACFFTP_30870, partial [Streptomyces roseoviridis]